METALSRFAEGFNGSQAVLSVDAEQSGLDDGTALKVAAGFGGGMGRMAGTPTTTRRMTLFKHVDAVRNTLVLFEAAQRAGVERIVHVSITNPSEDSPLEYFRGKATLEKALAGSGISYAILRPAVLFGKEDILINNIAWVLRRLPVFGVFGSGLCRLQPIYVDDLADLAVEHGKSRENVILNAIGPETFTYRELVGRIGQLIRKLDLRRIADVIKSVNPHVVALQEVDKGTQRTNRVDQPAELARLTGMKVVFGANIRYQGGDYGNAVLSRLPIKRHKNHLLPLFDDGEQRGVLEVEVEMPGGGGALLLLATHLDHRAADKIGVFRDSSG